MLLELKKQLVSSDNLMIFVSSIAVVVVVVLEKSNKMVQMTVDNMTEDRHFLFQLLYSMGNE